MIHDLIANLLMVIHLMWILFNLTGFFWARLWPIVGKIHVFTLGLTLAMFLVFRECPLTRWEWYFREMADPSVQLGGGFISHWLEKLIYVPIAPWIITIGTVLLFLFSLYLHIFRPRPKD